MSLESISHFIPVFFVALVLFQRISEVVHSNKNAGINVNKLGLVEASHLGWCFAVLVGGFFIEPLYNFWFLILYLVTQALRLWDLNRAREKWTLRSRLQKRSGLLWFASVAEGFALPFAFGFFELGLGVGLLNLAVQIYLHKKLNSDNSLPNRK
jgi:hypothetical protein